MPHPITSSFSIQKNSSTEEGSSEVRYIFGGRSLHLRMSGQRQIECAEVIERGILFIQDGLRVELNSRPISLSSWTFDPCSSV